MTKILIDEATVKLALSALEAKDGWGSSIREAKEKAITALREALTEQPAQQEPFGYLYEGTAEHTRGEIVFQRKAAERLEKRWWREIGPCYTSPQPAQRKPLTKEEFEVLHHKAKGYVHTGLMDVVRIVEHHHNIKENT